MIPFSYFLEEEKLKHLSHAEDKIIEDGKKGFRRSFQTLHSIHKALTGRSKNVTLSTKMDGAPSVVFGHHPETGQFFVASKSAWNKTPKLNYTHEDIERNHGHAPGLVSKLKTALDHLPKVTPKKGVYQGDFMYTKDEVTDHGDKYSFTPNTLTYHVPKNSAQGRKISKAQMGFSVHTSYHGNSFSELKSSHKPISGFRQHKDVHLISPEYDRTGSEYSPHRQARVRKALGMAIQKQKHINYKAVEGHHANLSKYINRTVKEKKRPTVQGYYMHLAQQPNTKPEHLEQVKNNIHHFKNLLSAHGYLELAKNTLVNALDTHSSFEHSINGKKSGPEGYVATYKGTPLKLVKRREDKLGGGFSAANFLNARFAKK